MDYLFCAPRLRVDDKASERRVCRYEVVECCARVMLLLMPIAHSFCLLPYSLQLVPRVTHSVPEKQESDGLGNGAVADGARANGSMDQ